MTRQIVEPAIMGHMHGRMAVATCALALAVITTPLLAGCSMTTHACSGPGVPVPSLYFDGSEWLAAHPGAELTACYDGHCQTLPANDSGLVQLLNTSGAYKKPRTLTVHSLHTSSAVRVSERITLNSVKFGGGACGTFTTRGSNARLNADGTLTVTRWEVGEVPQPATQVPGPTSTP